MVLSATDLLLRYRITIVIYLLNNCSARLRVGHWWRPCSYYENGPWVDRQLLSFTGPGRRDSIETT